MTFGYARVSTKTQARDGNSLEAQQAALTAAGAEKIYTDTFTGTKIERPEFDRLRAQLRRGDVLIVTKLDRLARSVSQASGLITEMIDEGVTINVLNLGILSNDSVNTLLRNVLLSFAQFERDMIVQRTQEGKAVARATELAAAPPPFALAPPQPVRPASSKDPAISIAINFFPFIFFSFFLFIIETLFRVCIRIHLRRIKELFSC